MLANMFIVYYIKNQVHCMSFSTNFLMFYKISFFLVGGGVDLPPCPSFRSACVSGVHRPEMTPGHGAPEMTSRSTV